MLGECAECQAEVSTQAESCPRCGLPFKRKPRKRPQLHSDFTSKAWIAILFYLLLPWIGGLIVNYIFISEAESVRDRIGRDPAGMGCLRSLWTICGIGGLIVIALAAIVLIFAVAAPP